MPRGWVRRYISWPAFAIASGIALICGLASAYLAHLHRQMSLAPAGAMSMMDMGMRIDSPWTEADLFFTFTMGAVMMVGMMSTLGRPAAAHRRRWSPLRSATLQCG